MAKPAPLSWIYCPSLGISREPELPHSPAFWTDIRFDFVTFQSPLPSMEERSSSRKNIHGCHCKSQGLFEFHILTLELKDKTTPHHTTEICFAEDAQNTGQAAASAFILTLFTPLQKRGSPLGQKSLQIEKNNQAHKITRSPSLWWPR